jgi:hypothetical protein
MSVYGIDMSIYIDLNLYYHYSYYTLMEKKGQSLATDHTIENFMKLVERN